MTFDWDVSSVTRSQHWEGVGTGLGLVLMPMLKSTPVPMLTASSF
jgi:hypothetical protein